MENTDQQPKQSPAGQLRGWIIVAAIIGGLYLLSRSDIVHTPRFAIVLMLALLMGWAWVGWKAMRDPAFAARFGAAWMKRQRRTWGRLVWLAVGLAVLVLLRALKIL